MACLFPLLTSAAQAQNVLTFSSVSHNFGSTPPNTPVVFGMKVTNSSTTTPYLNFAVTISGAGASAFSSATNCPASLAPTKSCEVIFTFNPTGTQTYQASWNVPGTGDSTFSYSPSLPGTLTGTGIVAAGLQVTTSGHNFGTEFKGYSSAPYGVVLTNSSTDPVALTIANGSTQFPLYSPSNNCPATLQPNKSCNIVWYFLPSKGTVNNQPTPYTFLNTISGMDLTTGQPVILTNGSGTQVSGVTLTGFGITGPSNYVGLSTSVHNFGDWGKGYASSLYGVQITNTEQTAVVLTYTSPASPNYFQIGLENCFPGGVHTATLAGGQSCQVQFYFQPTSATYGYLTSTYGLSATFNGSPINVVDQSSGLQVTGMKLYGTQIAGYLNLEYSSHNFGPYVLGLESGAFNDQLTNTGCATVGPSCPVVGDSYILTLTAGTGHASFPKSGTCANGATLAPGASCTLNFKFEPQALGAATELYGISAIDAVTNEPVSLLSGGAVVQGVSLSGYGVSGAGLFILNAANNFGEQGIGGASGPYTTYLYNTTGSTVDLSYAYTNPSEGTNFTLATGTGACGPTLATNAQCSLTWTFTPNVVGSITAMYDITATTGGSSVTITSIATNQPVSGVTLQGTGVN